MIGRSRPRSQRSETPRCHGSTVCLRSCPLSWEIHRGSDARWGKLCSGTQLHSQTSVPVSRGLHCHFAFGSAGPAAVRNQCLIFRDSRVRSGPTRIREIHMKTSTGAHMWNPEHYMFRDVDVVVLVRAVCFQTAAVSTGTRDRTQNVKNTTCELWTSREILKQNTKMCASRKVHNSQVLRKPNNKQSVRLEKSIPYK